MMDQIPILTNGTPKNKKNMKRQYIKLILIVLCCLIGFLIPGKKAYAVDPSVNGYVLTAGTNAPVAGVWVEWVTSANGTTPGGGAYQYVQTNAQGEFTFPSYDASTSAQMTALETTEISTLNNGVDNTTQMSSGAAQTTFGCAGNPNTFSVITPTGYNGTFDVQGTTSPTLNVTINNAAAPLNIGTFTYQPAELTVSGTVFIDSNKNGVQDASESGYPNGLVSVGNLSATTDTNGNYSIPNVPEGTETVKLTLPASYTNTTPTMQTISLIQNQSVNFGIIPTYTISGNVFVDTNRNGVKDTGEGNYSAAIITLSGSATGTTLSNVTGNYSFTGLLAGTYTVTVTVPPGYTNTSPTTQTFTLSSNQTANFGIAQLYTVSGLAFDDSNRTGTYQAGDTVFPNIAVTLTGPVTLSTVTNGNGDYSFANLQPGTYTVTFTNPPEHTNTTPLSQTFTLSTNYTLNFGTVGIYTVSGETYIDTQGNGVFSTSDTPYVGATVNLLDSAGDPFETTTTDTNGKYSFPNVYEGTYKISITMPTGYGATTPDLLDLTLGSDQTINFGINTLNVNKIAGKCTGSTADIVIVFDHSGSMNNADLATGQPKITEAIAATDEFINIIMQSVPSARIGVVQFSDSTNFPLDPTETGVLVPLTNNVTTLTTAVNAIKATGTTCHECGIYLANQMLQLNSRANSQKIVVLVTDGIANETIASNGVLTDFPTAENAAMNQIISGVTEQNIVYNTIGLGQNGTDSAVNIDVAFLQEIAAANGGLFLDDPEQGSMQEIFENLAANNVGSGIISGFVYNDKNNTGIYASNDVPIPNFNLTLSSNRLATPVTATTNASGDYTFTGLCTATYSVTEPNQPPWVPTTPNSQSLNVISGTTYPNVNFGNRYGYSITGDVFVDANKDGSEDNGEANYSGGSTITSSAGTITNNPDGSYSIMGLQPGSYQVSYISPLPTGYVMVNPLNGPPPSYNVTVGATCNTNSAPGAVCTSGNITTLSFGITDFFPWFQSTCNDVRNDNGITNLEPAGQYLVTSVPACSNPGLIFTGNATPNFGQGGSSTTGQVVGGFQNPEVFGASNLANLQTSYTNLLAVAKNANITPVSLSTICTLSNCTLPANLPHGLYLANGNVNLNAFTFPANQNYVFLINGNLTVQGNISTPVGSTDLFATSGNITIASTVGSAPNVTTSDLDGWYIAGNSFIIATNAVCSTLRLNISGSVVADAMGTGGTFQNNRDLCGNDKADPTVSFLPRLDMILHAPQFLEQQQTISQELAP
jgi:hypothetical protein